MKKILVLGAGGFIGGHLVKLLRKKNYVVSVDIKPVKDWWQVCEGVGGVHANTDLKMRPACQRVLSLFPEWDLVINLACNMGGIGFISNYEWECIRSVHINQNLVDACVEHGQVKRYFYSSSACVYPDKGSYLLKESDAWPAMPDHKYGLEKLFSEEYTLQAGKSTGLSVCIARFHNIFGPNGSYCDGREKFPAAMCRKVRDEIASGRRVFDMWGDGNQVRSYLYIDDCIRGIMALVNSDKAGPYNIGSEKMITCADMLRMLLHQVDHGKEWKMVCQPDQPQGVRGRGSDNTLVTKDLGWRELTPLDVGLKQTYEWISKQP